VIIVPERFLQAMELYGNDFLQGRKTVANISPLGPHDRAAGQANNQQHVPRCSPRENPVQIRPAPCAIPSM
jgi:hypothetical protein